MPGYARPRRSLSVIEFQSGGPLTIGRFIDSSRSVGLTGWIGGVAMFDRAFSAEELGKLAALSKQRL